MTDHQSGNQKPWFERKSTDPVPEKGDQVRFQRHGETELHIGRVVNGRKLWVSVQGKIMGDENNIKCWQYWP